MLAGSCWVRLSGVRNFVLRSCVGAIYLSSRLCGVERVCGIRAAVVGKHLISKMEGLLMAVVWRVFGIMEARRICMGSNGWTRHMTVIILS